MIPSPTQAVNHPGVVYYTGRVDAELGPGEMNACVNDSEGGGRGMVVELPKLECTGKGTRLEPGPMSGTAYDVQPKSI